MLDALELKAKAVNTQFSHLFESGHIGGLELPNRVIKAPQPTGMSRMDGSVSERSIRHYRELARGGTALIVVENAYVDDIASKSAQCQLGISLDEHIPGLAWLVDVVKDNGALAAIQIEHCGRQKIIASSPIKSASAVAWPALFERYGEAAIPQPLTESEIHEIVEAFGKAAGRAVEAGFDLVEIDGAHGYLITNFLSPHTNRRDDEYGGCLENRMRLLVEIIDRVRAEIGPDFPLTVQLSGTDYEPDGFGIEETVRVCQVIENHGISAVHISGGDHQQMIHQVSPTIIERGHNVWAAHEIKQHVKIPVVASGSITTPDMAEEIIAAGKADFVALGRSLWADPEWTRKAQEGRSDDIRPCIRCNEGCQERSFFRHRAVTCGVNPTVGHEDDLRITPATTKKQVVVVGGGPAGMEAARVCALRGHHVTLYEKRRLGGMLNAASVPDFMADLGLFRDYLVTQMSRLPIIVINKQAPMDVVSNGKYEVAILATGAVPLQPNIPGLNCSIVHNAVDVLSAGINVGPNVLVVGGGLIGTIVAIYLAEQDKQVTIVEQKSEIMLDCTANDRIAYRERLARNKVTTLTNHQLAEVSKSGAMVIDPSGLKKKIETDSVVMAVGYRANEGYQQHLEREGDMEVYAVGDCVCPGKICDAIQSAYKTALKI